MSNVADENVDVRHPMIRREYAIFTPPMDEMISTIGDWIDQQVSGGYIYGPSRYGKSRTVKWHLKAVLKERFQTVVPLIVWIRRDSAMSEGEFWNTLLGASKYEFHDPLKPRPKSAARFLFEQRLVTLTRSVQQNFVVLLIDEAHEVTLKEWKWLLGLQNSLDDEGVRLSVISIGSHGLTFQPNYLGRTGNAHIAARFFARDMKFRGLASAEELEYVFIGYDTDSEWPKNSGISYLQHFAPDDFARGHRLSSCTKDVWTAFEELLPRDLKINKKYRHEIPMQHFSHAVEQVLRRLAAGESWEIVTKYEEWLKMIAKTGFTNHMRSVCAPA